MFFRNLTLFRIPLDALPTAEAFTKALGTYLLREVGPLELSTRGFVSPFGRSETLMVLWQEQALLFAAAETTKILPSVVVADELAHRIAQVVDREGRRPGAKERKRMKEEVISDLLPRAFPRTTRTLAYIDLATGWLAVDTGSRRVAEDIVSMVREALGRFPAVPLAPSESPRNMMTGWLIDGHMPPGITLGEECELRDPAEAGAVVRCRRQDLESDEVREHLTAGKQAFQLGITFNERLGFVLAEDLVIRKLRFFDVVLDELGEGTAESIVAEMNSSFALMRFELRQVLEWLDDTFGLQAPGKERLKLDGGDAPKHMRESAVDEFGAADALYQQAVDHVVSTRRASISGIQRQLRIGYNRAAWMVDAMEKAGVVSAPESNGARTVLAAHP